jgi:hypothetical protein
MRWSPHRPDTQLPHVPSSPHIRQRVAPNDDRRSANHPPTPDQAARIHFVLSARGDIADSGNRCAVDRNIGNARFCATSIGDHAAANHYIKFWLHRVVSGNQIDFVQSSRFSVLLPEQTR